MHECDDAPHDLHTLGIAAVEDLIIEDMRAYLTFFDENTRKMIAVHPLTPLNTRADPDEPLSAPPTGSDGTRHYDFGLEFAWLADSEYDNLGVLELGSLLLSLVPRVLRPPSPRLLPRCPRGLGYRTSPSAIPLRRQSS